MATVSTRNSTVWVKWEAIVVHLGVVSRGAKRGGNEAVQSKWEWEWEWVCAVEGGKSVCVWFIYDGGDHMSGVFCVCVPVHVVL